MQRLALVLLFGGTLLVASWVVAGDPPARNVAQTSQVDQLSPVVTDVNAQVDRMRERLLAERRFAPPRRDPFRFSSRIESKPAVEAAPAVVTPEPAPLPLPQLVAILTDKVDGGVTRRAVLSFGGNVQIVKAGDEIDRFVVARVDADGVDLTERATTNTLRLSIKS